METIPNVLADRYASQAMRALWSPVGKIRLERSFWIAVLKAQRTLGLDIPAEAVSAYEAALDNIDLDDINRRERLTRHDVKARIEAFNALAGHEHIHKGMTSRDLTENVEQLQVFESLRLVRLKAVAALVRMAGRAREWNGVVLTARTHHVPAQPTTMGKRIAMFGEELLLGLEALHNMLNRYPARGLKGAVGTQLDPIRLLGGDPARAAQLEREILVHLGLPRVLDAVGQVYPRTLDFQVISILYALAGGPASFAKTLRLMAGLELAGEGFAPGQVGSSAMPHKMNSRSCERITGFHTILRGHLSMSAGLAGDQWNEGDVSCSVVRRVVLPDAFFALDGLLETFLTILDQMEIFPAVIDQENRRNFPFLLTTTVLMEAIRNGVGRETAHAAIRRHALAVVEGLRRGTLRDNDLLQRLEADPDLRLDPAFLHDLLANQEEHLGAAQYQVESFVRRVGEWEERFPAAAAVQPEAIL